MLRKGKLCRDCDKECRDKGTEFEPILIECPSCGGSGCGNCEHGQISILGCPNAACDGLSQAIELIDFFHKGQMPITGGVMDQSASFVEAARQLKNDENLIDAD